MAAIPTPSNRAGKPPPRPLAVHPARRRQSGFLGWLRLHQVTAAMVGGLLVMSAAVGAALALQQNTIVNPSAATPITFELGTDYTSINAAGFATITLGTSKTSATLAVAGVPGAASVSLGNVMQVKNNLASSFSITVTRSAAPPAALSGFTMTFKDSVTAATVATWNVASTASATFTIAASQILDISIVPVITDGTALGALASSFTLQYVVS